MTLLRFANLGQPGGWPKALRLDGSVRDPNALHVAMLERDRQRAHDFDLLHFHLDYYPFSPFSRQPTPLVTTLHGRLDLPEHQVVFGTFPSIPVISISDAGRRRRLPPPTNYLGSLAVIRRRFEETFTARRMAREYLAVYRGLMDKRRPRRSAHRAGELLAPSIAGAFADKAPLKKTRRSGTKVAFNGEVTRQRNQYLRDQAAKYR